ncbi:isochorismatase family hydrolase [Umbelopsis sp. PMI_123]|nr:isochorismatase family hydrolase [Umbelopsis sp. PMI_123]
MRFSFNLVPIIMGVVSMTSFVAADYNRLNLKDAAFLFIDHQVGLFSLVQDTNPDSFKNTILALADTALFFNSSVVLTTSREDGPNGPMLPELKEKFPDQRVIARPGQINAWDDSDFVKAVEATGKKQLIISGIVTDVCVTFVSLSAKDAGYEVFVVTDASGTFNKEIRDASWFRMEAGGIQLMNFFSVACELARDWRIDLTGLANLFGAHIPLYKAIMDGYNGAVSSAGKR